MNAEKPVALLINPPVYDFALFDLFHRPLGLMRIGRWLEAAGYRVTVVDALDITDGPSISALGAPRRNQNGTGKFFKQRAVYPLPGASAACAAACAAAGEAGSAAAGLAAGASTGGAPSAAEAAAATVKRRYSRYGTIAGSFERRIAETAPDIALITSGMTYWYPGVVETVRLVRKHHPQTPVCVGGVYASLLPDHCSRTAEPDYVVARNHWEELKGILSSMRLPVPRGEPDGRVLLSADLWRGAGVLRLNDGCPLRCDYCASHLLCPEFRQGFPEEPLEILEELAGACHLSSFAFYDDALLFRKEESLVPFLESVIGGELEISFYLPNAVHIGLLDLETVTLMRKAGFQEIRLGYESSSVAFHNHHDAKVNPGDFEDAVELLKEAGFKGFEIIAYILAGMPGQRWEEVEDSIRRVASAGVRASVAEFSPVPGTDLWERCVKESSFPIEEEPLLQNNSFMPLRWEGFTRDDLQRLKNLSRELSPPPGNEP